MSRKLLFNKNNANSYGYVRYAGAIISAKNTVKATMKNAILKGKTLDGYLPLGTLKLFQP